MVKDQLVLGTGHDCSCPRVYICLPKHREGTETCSALTGWEGATESRIACSLNHAIFFLIGKGECLRRNLRNNGVTLLLFVEDLSDSPADTKPKGLSSQGGSASFWVHLEAGEAAEPAAKYGWLHSCLGSRSDTVGGEGHLPSLIGIKVLVTPADRAGPAFLVGFTLVLGKSPKAVDANKQLKILLLIRVMLSQWSMSIRSGKWRLEMSWEQDLSTEPCNSASSPLGQWQELR